MCLGCVGLAFEGYNWLFIQVQAVKLFMELDFGISSCLKIFNSAVYTILILVC